MTPVGCAHLTLSLLQVPPCPATVTLLVPPWLLLGGAGGFGMECVVAKAGGWAGQLCAEGI